MLNAIQEEQDNYLKQILDNFPDGIFTISTELEIHYVNPAFCKLLGFNPNELLGTPITDYLGDLNILNTCMAEVSASGRCNDQETIFKRKDGTYVHISKNVQAIFDRNGQFKEILVSIRDLTNLHALNKDLEHSKHHLEKMLVDLSNAQAQLVEAEKMASLGNLVAGVAHEINTPLGISITSASSMHEELKVLKSKFEQNALKKAELESFFDHAKEACNILHTNLYRASDLVRSFKQVAVDQALDELRVINVKNYCDEILVSIGPSFKHTKIKVNNCCDDIELMTHPGAFYQIISNLTLNSIIHGFNEGDSGVINISARKENGRIIIEHSDDGKGVSSTNLKRIFEPFYTTRRGQGGSGLGLSIVYSLVTGRLNGHIHAKSDEGKGMRIEITLPVQ